MNVTKIKQAVKGTLGTTQAFVIKECLEVIKTIDGRIKNIDTEISTRMRGEDYKRNFSKYYFLDIFEE